jgi:hypothetical protein
MEDEERRYELANQVANVLADNADTLDLMHVTVDGGWVHAWKVWTGEGLGCERVHAFIVTID